ncbi:uncharacterized protein [Temnothorax longispinosus]|uniref:uncharacterized protein isoform X3 n=1 Tax=Temnothorax longispinosus TaxID=300112 RepID=UPI003A9993C9
MLVHVLREYNVNKILLSRLGLWPFQSRLVRNSLPMFCLIFEISYYPFEILMLYDHRDDAQMVFEGCYQFVISTAFIVRLWNEIWNRDKFRRLYEAMNDHWDIFTNELEIRVLKNYSVISRKFTIFYSTMMYLLSSMFVIIPLTPTFLDIVLPLNESRPRILAIDVEFRVDTDEYFVPIFCYTTAIILVGISIMVGADTMHFTCTTHACSLFSIIGEQIEQITSTQHTRKCECGSKEHDWSKEQVCRYIEFDASNGCSILLAVDWCNFKSDWSSNCLCIRPARRNGQIYVYNYGSVITTDDHVLFRSEINGRKPECIPSSVIIIQHS